MVTPSRHRSLFADFGIVFLLVIGGGLIWIYQHAGRTATIITAIGAVVIGITVYVVVEAHKGGTKGHRMNRAQISKEMGELRLHLAKHVLPGIDTKKVSPDRLGLLIGKDIQTARGIWSSIEDSTLVVGPPRSGKTASIVIPYIVSYPGSVAATSTRPEIVVQTATQRLELGPCFSFAPQSPDISVVDGVEPLRWSPVKGCEEPLVAIVRAGALVASGSGLGSSVSNSDFWAGSASAIMRCYLHAAAIGGKTISDVVQWSHDPTSNIPIDILSKSGLDSAEIWAAELAKASADPKMAANVWAGVRRSLDALADPRVLKACSPPPGSSFDVDNFLREQSTLYLWGDASSQLSVAPLLACLLASITDTAKHRASAMKNGRLQPPLGLILDEVANIAPLPNMPGLLSESGGVNISTVVILQSLAQARHRWGDAQASSMWDAATIKLILPGLSQADDLGNISRLAGEVPIEVESHSAGSGGTSTSTSQMYRPKWSAQEIRSLPDGHALVFYRRLDPIELRLIPYWDRQKKTQKK